MQTAIAKWGNSLAVRLPRNVVADANLYEGAMVEVTAEQGRLIVTPARPKYKLAELLERLKPEQQHEEVDWGEPKGEEAW